MDSQPPKSLMNVTMSPIQFIVLYCLISIRVDIIKVCPLFIRWTDSLATSRGLGSKIKVRFVHKYCN